MSVTITDVATNGARNDYSGTITVTGPAIELDAFLDNGFYVCEEVGTAENWTYDDQVWEIKRVSRSEAGLEVTDSTDSTETVIAVRKVTLQGRGYIPAGDWQLPANLIFTNKYTENNTPAPSRPHYTPTPTEKIEAPKTFDAGIAVYGVMAVSSLLGMGYMGKKKF